MTRIRTSFICLILYLVKVWCRCPLFDPTISNHMICDEINTLTTCRHYTDWIIVTRRTKKKKSFRNNIFRKWKTFAIFTIKTSFESPNLFDYPEKRMHIICMCVLNCVMQCCRMSHANCKKQKRVAAVKLWGWDEHLCNCQKFESQTMRNNVISY